MGKLNLLISLNAFTDFVSSNSPAHNLVKWTRELNAFPVQDDAQGSGLFLAPGETKTLLNGMATLTQSGSTTYSLSPLAGVPSSYVLQYLSGSAPTFRTPRTTGADATTQVNVSMNGPVMTLTSSPGAFASFTGLIPGMISSVTITALNAGPAGNSVILAGDGISSVSTLINTWNSANPSNMVTLSSGNGTQIPDAGTFADFIGLVDGMSSSVTITANTLGTAGNGITLVGNGTSSVSTLISAWNTANPSNPITLNSGDGTQIPSLGLYANFMGTPSGFSTPITITALTLGTIGNSVTLTGDGTSDINSLIADWNIINPANQVVLSAGDGTQILTNGTMIFLTNGVNSPQIVLAGGIDADIILTGGLIDTQFDLLVGSVVPGDQVIIGTNFGVPNQGTFTILSVTATGFSVNNPMGVAQGPVSLGAGFATQVQIFSAAGVQIGNTLVISSGFSPISQASYLITAVSATALTFTSGQALPTEIGIMTQVVVYTEAKNLIYMESNQKVSVAMNAANSINIEPFIDPCGCDPTTPGMLLNKSTIYFLSVTNISESTATLYFASAE